MIKTITISIIMLGIITIIYQTLQQPIYKISTIIGTFGDPEIVITAQRSFSTAFIILILTIMIFVYVKASREEGV